MRTLVNNPFQLRPSTLFFYPTPDNHPRVSFCSSQAETSLSGPCLVLNDLQGLPFLFPNLCFYMDVHIPMTPMRDLSWLQY